MAEATQEMPIGPIAVQRIPNPNRPTIYANNTVIAGNQWDVQLYFSLVHEIAPGQFGATEQALVILTPEHALALSKALQRTLENFAQHQGGIRDVKPVELGPTELEKLEPPKTKKS
jgi:hypothetical protein